MTTSEDTRPERHNTGDGVPTTAELINHLADAGGPVDLSTLTDQTGISRGVLKAHLASLEERGLVIVSIGLYHVSVQLVDGVHPIPDGGAPELPTEELDILDLTPTDVFMALSAQRRRETIRVLARQSRQQESKETYVDVSSLSEMVCRSGVEVSTTSQLDTDERHATYVGLTQTHLPLLDNFEIVEYYERVQKVSPTDAALTLDAVISMIDAVCGGDADAK